MTEAAGGQAEDLRERLAAAVARREYLPSPTTGQPDAPPRRDPAPLGILGLIAEGARTIVAGHIVTLRTFWRRKVTEQYPFRNPERNWKPRPGYRGDFALISDRETGRLRCTACMQCAQACPAGCIYIVGEGRGKERGPAKFAIDAGLCMYCWHCVEVCPFAAITMTPDYETAMPRAEYLIRDLEYLKTRGLEFRDVLRPAEVAQEDEDAADPGTRAGDGP